MIKKKLRNTRQKLEEKGSFLNFSFWTFSGKFIGVLGGALLTPLITRIYGPEAYGVFSFMNALMLNLSVLGTMKLPLAFVIPDKEEEFTRLLRGVMGLLLGVSLLLFVLSLFVQFFSSVKFFGVQYSTYWALYLGPGVLLYGAWELMNNWKVREGYFKKGAGIGFCFNLSVRGFSIIHGLLLGKLGVGLLHGEFFGRFLGIYLFIKWIFKGRVIPLLRKLSLNDIRFVLHSYSKYPRFIMPSHWIMMLSGQSLILLFTFFSSTGQIGAYALAVGMLNLPFRLSSGTLLPVFRERVKKIQQARDRERMFENIDSLTRYLLWGGALPAFLTLYFGEFVFLKVFGERWGDSGIYAGILVWSVWVRVISTTIFPAIYLAYRMEQVLFRINVLLFFLRTISVGVGIWMESFYTAIVLFTISNLFVSWLQIALVFSFVGQKEMDRYFFYLGGFLAVCALSWTFHLHHPIF